MAGSILREPEEQKESRSFCRLPSGEAASLRASRPSSALSSRGFHGSGSSTGARDARAGGGEAAVAREQGRYLSPTSELFSPPPPPHSLPRPVPEAPGIGLSPAPGRALAQSPPAGRERPGPGLAATCRGLRPLPLRAKLCRSSAPTAGPGAAQLLQRVQPAERRRRAEKGYWLHGPAPQPSPGRHPGQPRSWRSPG